MIFEDVPDFLGELPRGEAIAGLDLGTHTIGVALSDRLLTVATPLDTIRRKKFTQDAEALMSLLNGRDAAGIVLGLPRNMDGTEGPRCQATRAFARNLSAKTDLPITFWDERLSTVAAERALLEADTSRKRRAQVIDQIAAAYILQGVLDRIRQLGNENARATRSGNETKWPAPASSCARSIRWSKFASGACARSKRLGRGRQCRMTHVARLWLSFPTARLD